MPINPTLGRQQHADFLARYPLEQLATLTLEEYSNLDKRDSFTYFLESLTRHVGSIGGGSAYKFGIYRRADTDKDVSRNGYASDGVYAWTEKYGATREEAWRRVHELIRQTAQLGHAGDFSAVDNIDLGHAYKWKIAFMYGQAGLIPIYQRKMLAATVSALGHTVDKSTATSELQRLAYAAKRPQENPLEAAARLLEVDAKEEPGGDAPSTGVDLLPHQRFDKLVYDSLLARREREPGFTFYLRQQSSHLCDLELLRGDGERQRCYTNFHHAPAGRGAPIHYLGAFCYYSGEGYRYELQVFNSPHPDVPGNAALTELCKRVGEQWVNYAPERAVRNKRNSRHEGTTLASKQANYPTAAAMLTDLQADLDWALPISDAEVAAMQQTHPDLDVRRFTEEEFQIFRERQQWRHNQYTRDFYAYERYGRNFWLLGSDYGGTQDMLPLMQARNVVAAGSHLHEEVPETLVNAPNKDIKEYLVKRGVEDTPSFKTIKHFLNMRPGDLVAVKKGANNVHALALVLGQDQPIYRHDPELQHTHAVEWIPLAEPINTPYTYRGTLFNIDDPERIGTIFGTHVSLPVPLTQSGPTNSPHSVSSTPRNQIYYGPPGTGKTYRTIAAAVRIADPAFPVDSAPRAELQTRYRELVRRGRIVFTTFHQSLSYEDFVEGLKPKLTDTEEDNIGYEIQRGVFQRMSINAAFHYYDPPSAASGEMDKSYGERFDDYVAHVEEMEAKGETIKLQTKTGRGAEIIGLTGKGNIRIKHDNGENEYIISKDRQVRLDEGINNFDNLPQGLHTLFTSIIGGNNASMHWAVMNAVREFRAPTVPVSADINVSEDRKTEIVARLRQQDFRAKNVPNYVLIIDEINRGNVSRIFGELITLLEPDKRLGAAEGLTVTLPYSRTRFGVPPNLFLIGTMNTADRSVVALDAALRRRFRFTEIAPNPEVVTQVYPGGVTIAGRSFNPAEIMRAINDRVELLRDRDHRVGHSYFLKMRDADAVAEQFATGIIPLLREYFYEDYAQILLILGSGFIRVESPGQSVAFPAGADTGDLDLSAYRRYGIVNYQNDPAGLAAALDILLNNPVEA